MTPQLDLSAVIAIVSLFAQSLVIVAAGVWAVSALRSTSAVLQQIVATLVAAVDALKIAVEKIKAVQNDHEVRLRLIEDTRTHTRQVDP